MKNIFTRVWIGIKKGYSTPTLSPEMLLLSFFILFFVFKTKKKNKKR